MADIQVPAEIAEGPLSRRLEWYLRHVRKGGPELSNDELETNFASDPQVLRQTLARTRASIPGSTLTAIRKVGSRALIGELVQENGHAWDCGFAVESIPPYRIRTMSQAQRVPGVLLRTATPADAAALRQIELDVPVVAGEASVVYDRGADYFEAEHLMGEAVTHVVEMAGRPVGLTSWVLHPVRVKGMTILGGFKHKMRLMKEARGQGVRQMLDFAGFEVHASSRDVFYTYSAVANDNVRHIYGESGWRVYPERVVIDAARHAGPPTGRTATPADGEHIVELLNRTHEREEMYVPYTQESLAGRLSRVPRAYSWQNLRIGERAVIGVWPARLNVIRTTGGETTRDVRGLVLDFGYEEGAEDELVALLRAECAALSANDSTEMAIFTCAQAGVYARLSTLAKRKEPYMAHIGTPPPDDLADRGLYVDQLYF